MAQQRIASGVVLVLLGIWLLMQTVAGDLARRLLSWGNPTPVSTRGADTPPADPDGRSGGGFSSGGGAGGGGGGYGAN